MRLSLAIIGAAVLTLAVGGAFFLRGGEYAMFLLALALVCFFGSLPVVLGVLTRRGRERGGRAAHPAQDEVVIAHESGAAGDRNARQ